MPNDPTTPTDIAHLRELLAKAKRLPWEANHPPQCQLHCITDSDNIPVVDESAAYCRTSIGEDDEPRCDRTSADKATDADHIDLIVALVNAAPALLDELEKYRTMQGGRFWKCLKCGGIQQSHNCVHPCRKCGTGAGKGLFTETTYETWKETTCAN